MKSYGLVEEIATTTGGVELVWTLDGAKLTKKSGHVTGGFKLVDRRSIDPLSGCPMFVAADDNSSLQTLEATGL